MDALNGGGLRYIILCDYMGVPPEKTENIFLEEDSIKKLGAIKKKQDGLESTI